MTSLQHLRSQANNAGQLSSPLLADVSSDRRNHNNLSSRENKVNKIPENHEANGTRIHKNQLKTLNGVVVPCMLNIMGIVLFLRLGWGIGQIGVLGCFIFFIVGEIASIMTVLSFSAIITNGKMEGGGSYFMLSRAMGPEFGGSIGILFYAAYAVGCCFYIVGFSTEVTGTFLPESANNFGINLAIGSGSLLLVTAIAYGGAEAFTKINIWLFVGQFGSLTCSLVIMLALTFIATGWPLVPLNSTHENSSNIDNIYGMPLDHNGTFYPWDMDRFFNNSMWSLETGIVQLCNMGPCTFTLVFSVLYPSVSGIMEGANLSGDLKDPSGSIPKGTLIAIFASFVFYAIIIVVLAGCFDRETLIENTMVMQDILHWKGQLPFDGQYIIVAGVCISTLSSALGALFGGSRVLQAIAKDRLFPCLNFFAKGTPKGDEPRRAVILTWLIAQLCLFMGDLNTIAPVLSCFFCLSYAAVNFACFVLDISGAPNFRPTWKFYSWHLSLLGTFLNLGIMFYLNGVYGVIACGLLILIFFILTWTAPVVEWGDVSQALIFHQVRKYLLMLNNKKQHRKYWRPSILLISNEVDPLIEFCANLKKGGLFVLGTVIKGDFADLNSTASRVKQAWQKIILQAKIKAFSQIVIAPSARIGYASIVTCHGLGAMNANTVVIPFCDPDAMSEARSSKLDKTTIHKAWCEHAVRLQRWPWSPPSTTPLPPIFESVEEFVSVVQDVLLARKNVLITRNFHKLRIITRQLGGQKNTKSTLHALDDVSAPVSWYEGASGELRDVVADTEQIDHRSDKHSGNGTIDVWIVGSWDVDDLSRSLSLLLQLAHIIHEKREWKKQTTLRLLQVIDAETSIYHHGVSSTSKYKNDHVPTSQAFAGGGSESKRSDDGNRPVNMDLKGFTIGQNVRIQGVDRSGRTVKAKTQVAQIVNIFEDGEMYLKVHGSQETIVYPGDCDGLPEALTPQEEIKYCEGLLRKLAASVRINVAEVCAFHLDLSRDKTQSHNLRRLTHHGDQAPCQQSFHTEEGKLSQDFIFKHVNDLISRYSKNAVTIFFPLPPVPKVYSSQDEKNQPSAKSRATISAAEEYMRNIKVLTQDLPPVVLVRMGKGGEGVISTEM